MFPLPSRLPAPVLDALFPLSCAGCGRTGAAVCAGCAAALRPAPSAPPPAGVDAWASAFAYEGPARELVARVKYRGVRGVIPWLTPHLAAAASTVVAGSPGPVVVTWAPTTPERRRSRGFDHAELLARAVARELGRPCRPLLRRRPGPPQTGLPAGSRRAGPRLESAPSAAHALGRWATVLVVDDVATTGATLAAAANALRAGGAARVLALTAARTPPPRAR